MNSNQRITFVPVMPAGAAVTVARGRGPAVSEPGDGGGWIVVARPKRKSFTDWQGYGPYQTEIPILFDGYASNRSVERDIEALRRMMRVPAQTTGHPPVIKVRGAIPLADRLRWVIQDIEEEDEIRRPSDGARVRAWMTVTLLEYVPADVVVERTQSSPAAAAKENKQETSSAPTSSGTYTVKAGDTLWAIATAKLGSGQKWTEIAQLNNIRDPKTLQIGTRLRIP